MEVFNMNFKRILAGVMAGATAISLAACSNSGNGGFDSTATSDTSSTDTTIDDEKEYMDRVHAGMDYYCRVY